MADEQKPAAEEAKAQQGDGDWPKPGDEGYVHPDGTPQSKQQLEDNKRAAADRAAAGSTVHGAPLATPGPQARAEAERAQQRAEEYSGTSAVEAEEGLTKFITEGIEERTEEASKRDEDAEGAQPAAKKDRESAADTTPKTRRA